MPTIVGELKRHFRDRTWTVSVPRSVKDLSVALSKQVDRLSNELGRSPTIAELADATGADEEQIVEALEATRAQAVRPLVTGSEDDGELGPIATARVEEPGFAAGRRPVAARPTGCARSTRASGRSSSCGSTGGLKPVADRPGVGISQMHI